MERPKTVESQIEGSSSKSSLDKSFGTLLQLSSLTVKSGIRTQLNKSSIKNSKEVYITKFYHSKCLHKEITTSGLIVEFSLFWQTALLKQL